jgi:hypothetical protein
LISYDSGDSGREKMAGNEQPGEEFYHAVTGLLVRIPPERNNVLLVDITTPDGTFRFVMPKSVALQVGAAIAGEAEKLAADQA